MDMLFHTKHERKHGKALTKDEESLLLAYTAGTPYQQMFAVALYTGLRPNEYKTAYIENGFIVANNSKRKNGKTALKKIPITPMLAPYVKDDDSLSFYRLEQIRHKFNSILPEHKLEVKMVNYKKNYHFSVDKRSFLIEIRQFAFSLSTGSGYPLPY